LGVANKKSVATVTPLSRGCGQSPHHRLLATGILPHSSEARQLGKIYSVVHAEMNERRILRLEIIIVIFFVIDLLIPLRIGR
jgi:hypothetical protein